MSSKKRTAKVPKTGATAEAASPQKAPSGQGTAGKKKGLTVSAKAVKLTCFALLVIFCTFVYGDVFARAEQESFVTADLASMKFLLDKPLGGLYLAGRWMLAVCKSKWIGGLIIASVLTATACQLGYILRLPARWRGVSFLLPAAELLWVVTQGTNLYYKREPSRFMLLIVGVFAVLLIVSLVLRFIRRKKTLAETPKTTSKPFGFAIALIALGGLFGYTLAAHQNTVLTARMQQRLWQQDWEGMVSDGLSARRPTRAVAAYYAIGLLQQGELLEGLFDIPYNYPINGELAFIDGSEEYGLLQADADFECGLVQVGYHYALEFCAMNGPTTRMLKRMAVCALVMGEKELAAKYLRILEGVPFEGKFVAQYRPMLEKPELIDQDPELATVKKLWPREQKFEQQYRQPAFMGYNIGLNEGSDMTLLTSVAACLYSKDLLALMPRVTAMQQKGMTLPVCVQQAIGCLSLKDKGAHKGVLQMLPNQRLTVSQLENFIIDARPYMKDKDELRERLRDKWLGTYMYYYYCENNDSIATGKKSPREAAVN